MRRPAFKLPAGRPLPLPKVASVLASILLGGYLLGLLTISAGSMSAEGDLSKILDCKDKSYKNLPIEVFNPEQNCPSVIEAVVNLSSVDFDGTPRLTGTLRIWPAGELGGVVVNSGVAQRALEVNYENIGATEWKIPASNFVGSRTFAVPLNDNGAIDSYPFDSYKGSWTATVQDWQTSASLPTALSLSERPIYGWSIGVTAAKSANNRTYQKTFNFNGTQRFEWTAERSTSIQLSVLLLLAVILVGIGSAIGLTVSIYRRNRPPTLGALGWLATSLFAIIEIRSRFPGNPPPGIFVDKFITYPATIALLGLILTHTYMWINRDDWDMKNTPNENFRS